MRSLISIFILLLSCQLSRSQLLLDAIENAEKSVLYMSAYDNEGNLVGNNTGFIISSDGIAVMPARYFENYDSIQITTFNGKPIRLDRILSVHRFSNLAIVKVKNSKNKDFSYLIPSQEYFSEPEDVLVLCNKADAREQSVLTSIKQTIHLPFMERVGLLNISLSDNSTGGPVINGNGNLVGIAASYLNNDKALLYNVQMLNDTNWINVNVKFNSLKNDVLRKYLMNNNFNEGFLHLFFNKPVEAAKCFSQDLKMISDDSDIYSLRGWARFQYKNNIGAWEDMTKALALKKNAFLPYYFHALHQKNQGEPGQVKALQYLDTCLYNYRDFSLALVEHAKLSITIRRRVEDAFVELSSVISTNSEIAEAYFERARILIANFDNNQLAIEDLDKAVKLDPSLPGVYSIRGTLKFSKQDYMTAMEDFNKALNKDPIDVHALFNRGMASYNLGLNKNACKDWRRAGELGHYKAFKYISRYCTKNR